MKNAGMTACVETRAASRTKERPARGVPFFFRIDPQAAASRRLNSAWPSTLIARFRLQGRPFRLRTRHPPHQESRVTESPVLQSRKRMLDRAAILVTGGIEREFPAIEQQAITLVVQRPTGRNMGNNPLSLQRYRMGVVRVTGIGQHFQLLGRQGVAGGFTHRLPVPFTTSCVTISAYAPSTAVCTF